MNWIFRTCIIALLMMSIPVMGSLTERKDSQHTQTEMLLSRYLHLSPTEVSRWQQIKENGSLQGFVEHQSMSAYEILALHTNDQKALRRLARLFATQNLKIIAKLKKFERIYQQELENLR